MVKRVVESRSDFIKSALMKYIIQNYCHNFKTEKDIEKKISRAVEEIADTITSVDR